MGLAGWGGDTGKSEGNTESTEQLYQHNEKLDPSSRRYLVTPSVAGAIPLILLVPSTSLSRTCQSREAFHRTDHQPGDAEAAHTQTRTTTTTEVRWRTIISVCACLLRVGALTLVCVYGM